MESIEVVNVPDCCGPFVKRNYANDDDDGFNDSISLFKKKEEKKEVEKNNRRQQKLEVKSTLV